MRFSTGLACLLLGAVPCSAQFTDTIYLEEYGFYLGGEGDFTIIPSATWVGSDESPNWTDTANWHSQILPANDGSALVFFLTPRFDFEEREIVFDTAVDVNTLIFDESSNLDISSNYNESDSLTIREAVFGLSTETYSEVYFGPSLPVTTVGDTDWILGYGFGLELAGPFTNSGSLLLEGGGTLLFNYDNSSTFSGEIIVVNGSLGIAHDDALGTAEIILGGSEDFYESAVLVAIDGDRSIPNNIRVAGGYLSTTPDYFSFDEYNGEPTEFNELNLQGTVVFENNAYIDNYGGLLSFEGTVTEMESAISLTISGNNPVIFDGITNISGGIISQGEVIFGDDDALPSGPTGGALIAEEFGYIGLIEETESQRLAALGTFLSLFDPSLTAGTIGLDTNPGGNSVNEYTGPIDLTGFNPNVTLGTLTRAAYTGLLTPAGTDYRFGNGGGTLLLGSTLTDDGSTPRGLHVISDFNSPLTVFVNSSSNSFSGNVVAQNSAVIFGHAPGTLPGDASFSLSTGGYIGYQDTTIPVASFLNHFDTATATGIIGFDSQDRHTNLAITDAIDLSRFTATSAEFYIGTSTWVNLGGTITLPAGNPTYRFTGYKGGFLNVTSVLSGANSVIIGDLGVPATGYFRNANQESLSGVSLDANNTYTGGTTLQYGQLVITSATSLGTGPLTAFGNSYADYRNASMLPYLRPNAEDIVLPNNIVLNSWLGVETPFGLNDSNLELGGVVSGSGGILKSNDGTLILSGDNTFEGGVFIEDGVLKIQSDTAAGTGPLGMNVDNNQQVFFNSSAPTIGGLFNADSDEEFFSSTGGTVELLAGTTLTIAPAAGYRYDFEGSINGQGGLVISGTGTQRLSGYNTYTGGTTISGGATLVADGFGALGQSNFTPATAPGIVSPLESANPSVILDNGTLLVGNGVELNVEITFGTNGGTIGGNGTFNLEDPLTIATGAQIAPGHSVGELNISGDVNFAPGGKLAIELGQGDGDSIIADTVQISALNITATALNPFTVFVSDEYGYVANNFDPTQAYSWNIVTSTSGFTQFDLQSFALFLDTPLQGLGNGGFFSLAMASGTVDSMVGTDNILELNFTPVPEPSTFALLALGLAFIGFQSTRRRQG